MSANPFPVHSPPSWWRLIDWRLVAAIGLPLWAFVFGMIVPWKPAAAESHEPLPVPVVSAPATPQDDGIPPPREIVVRTSEPVTLPVVVPVPIHTEEVVAANPPVEEKQPEAANPPEFQLPASELLPAAHDGCQTYGTKVRFHKDPAEAITAAKSSKKMLFVLHISGHFDDPGFT